MLLNTQLFLNIQQTLWAQSREESTSAHPQAQALLNSHFLNSHLLVTEFFKRDIPPLGTVMTTVEFA